MIHSFDLDAQTLALFVQTRRLDPGEQARFVRRFEEGKVAPEHSRVAYREDEPVAAYTLTRTGEGVLVGLSLRRPLDVEERLALLDDVRQRASRPGPVRVLVSRARSLHLLGEPGEGWTLESHAVLHDTPLATRPPVPPAPAFVGFGREELDTEEFGAFLSRAGGEFTPTGLHEHYEDVEHFTGLLLREEGRVVAAGAAHEQRPGVASLQILGVERGRRGRGLGTALHAALMDRAASFATLYVGATDAANAPMRRLFEKNGCVPTDEQWTYRPT